jgi:hypothetical protein
MEDWNMDDRIALLALIVSITALLASGAFALLQIRLMRRANQIPQVVGLTQELRTDRFLDCERYVLHRLSKNDPTLGQAQLPHRAGDSMQVVASIFNTIGILVKFKVIDSMIAVSIFGPRAEQAWKILKPFIEEERRIRQGDYMPCFEHFVALSQEQGSEEVSTSLKLRTVTG